MYCNYRLLILKSTYGNTEEGLTVTVIIIKVTVAKSMKFSGKTLNACIPALTKYFFSNQIA